jgi:hypothetical protein
MVSVTYDGVSFTPSHINLLSDNGDVKRKVVVVVRNVAGNSYRKVERILILAPNNESPLFYASCGFTPGESATSCYWTEAE